MAFIETISSRQANGGVRKMYARQQAKFGYVPNYAKIFSHRPEIMRLWADLLRGIRRNLDDRRFELVTLAAAFSLRSSYCSLAHGRALSAFYSADEIRAIIDDSEEGPLTAGEREMIRFARKIARDAAGVTTVDIERLKGHGFGDAEIFDIAAAAAARSFFAQLCEGLGAIADASHLEMEERLRDLLTVGRGIDDAEPERLA